MIPKAISKPTANAAPIDSATAATGFIWRGALLIGTIHLPIEKCSTMDERPPPRQCGNDCLKVVNGRLTLLLVPISFRSSTDIRTVQNVLAPFIDLDDDGPYGADQNNESEK